MSGNSRTEEKLTAHKQKLSITKRNKTTKSN